MNKITKFPGSKMSLEQKGDIRAANDPEYAKRRERWQKIGLPAIIGSVVFSVAAMFVLDKGDRDLEKFMEQAEPCAIGAAEFGDQQYFSSRADAKDAAMSAAMETNKALDPDTPQDRRIGIVEQHVSVVEISDPENPEYTFSFTVDHTREEVSELQSLGVITGDSNVVCSPAEG